MLSGEAFRYCLLAGRYLRSNASPQQRVALTHWPASTRGYPEGNAGEVKESTTAVVSHGVAHMTFEDGSECYVRGARAAVRSKAGEWLLHRDTRAEGAPLPGLVDLGALFDWLGMQGSSLFAEPRNRAEVIEGSNVDIMYFQITGESARRLCAANHLPAFRGVGDGGATRVLGSVVPSEGIVHYDFAVWISRTETELVRVQVRGYRSDPSDTRGLAADLKPLAAPTSGLPDRKRQPYVAAFEYDAAIPRGRAASQPSLPVEAAKLLGMPK
jgi:hypothetical protein